MALIIFLRGLNVGGFRKLRPSVLAKELAAYKVVNIGAAGTFIVRQPGSRAAFLAELRKKLPFETQIAFCYAHDLRRLESENPFSAELPEPDTVQFLSILVKPGHSKIGLPVTLPAAGTWFVRIIGSRNRLVFGVYRRHMKTIGYLSQLDNIFGAPATTRSWSTILSILQILRTRA